MAQPPSPHAITGSLSLTENLPRSSGRKTTWPGEPKAGSDMTLYGPGIAFGAPSSGSVVLTRSVAGAGGCANETHAVRTNAVASADFMRHSSRVLSVEGESSCCLPRTRHLTRALGRFRRHPPGRGRGSASHRAERTPPD